MHYLHVAKWALKTIFKMAIIKQLNSIVTVWGQNFELSNVQIVANKEGNSWLKEMSPP